MVLSPVLVKLWPRKKAREQEERNSPKTILVRLAGHGPRTRLMVGTEGQACSDEGRAIVATLKFHEQEMQ